MSGTEREVKGTVGDGRREGEKEKERDSGEGKKGRRKGTCRKEKKGRGPTTLRTERGRVNGAVWK